MNHSLGLNNLTFIWSNEGFKEKYVVLQQYCDIIKQSNSNILLNANVHMH